MPIILPKCPDKYELNKKNVGVKELIKQKKQLEEKNIQRAQEKSAEANQKKHCCS